MYIYIYIYIYIYNLYIQKKRQQFIDDFLQAPPNQASKFRTKN